MSAKASGTDAGKAFGTNAGKTSATNAGKPSGTNAANGDRSHAHNQGNQDRTYTTEQKAAVLRIRRCSPTAFYEILGLKEVRTSCSEGEIKKAYRKQSLLTHPDKNGHEHADEAFKMVSRAFGVLSDADKRKSYDRHGGDPDSKSGAAAAGSQFGGHGFGPRRRGWEENAMSPEEMFNQFFGGGMGGGPFGQFGGGMFDTGPGFVFDLGRGGPGIRVTNLGGNRPRTRPREPGQQQTPPSLRSVITNLLPLIILFIFPLLSTLFSHLLDGSSASGPRFRFDYPVAPYTLQRQTPNHRIDYWVNPAEVSDLSARKLGQLDKQAELSYVHGLQVECDAQVRRKQEAWDASLGWFGRDQELAARAKALETRSCDRLRDMNLPLGRN